MDFAPVDVTPQTFDLALSQQLSKTVQARAFECFRNAFRALRNICPDAFYVEGYAVMDGTQWLDIHAWLELDGKIVDPTYCNRALPLSQVKQRDGKKKREPV